MISEDDAADYRQQTLEDRERERLERMGRRGGPDAPEACEKCRGFGYVGEREECRRCLGTGVQP